MEFSGQKMINNPKPKAYLKIGMYQSVVPCSVPPDYSCDLVNWIEGKRLRFQFIDSGQIEEDGIPIWIATGLEVI